MAGSNRKSHPYAIICFNLFLILISLKGSHSVTATVGSGTEGEWSDWGDCSADCGRSFAARHRHRPELVNWTILAEYYSPAELEEPKLRNELEQEWESKSCDKPPCTYCFLPHNASAHQDSRVMMFRGKELQLRYYTPATHCKPPLVNPTHVNLTATESRYLFIVMEDFTSFLPKPDDVMVNDDVMMTDDHVTPEEAEAVLRYIRGYRLSDDLGAEWEELQGEENGCADNVDNDVNRVRHDVRSADADGDEAQRQTHAQDRDADADADDDDDADNDVDVVGSDDSDDSDDTLSISDVVYIPGRGFFLGDEEIESDFSSGDGEGDDDDDDVDEEAEEEEEEEEVEEEDDNDDDEENNDDDENEGGGNQESHGDNSDDTHDSSSSSSSSASDESSDEADDESVSTGDDITPVGRTIHPDNAEECDKLDDQEDDDLTEDDEDLTDDDDDLTEDDEDLTEDDEDLTEDDERTIAGHTAGTYALYLGASAAVVAAASVSVRYLLHSRQERPEGGETSKSHQTVSAADETRDVGETRAQQKVPAADESLARVRTQVPWRRLPLDYRPSSEGATGLPPPTPRSPRYQPTGPAEKVEKSSTKQDENQPENSAAVLSKDHASEDGATILPRQKVDRSDKRAAVLSGKDEQLPVGSARNDVEFPVGRAASSWPRSRSDDPEETAPGFRRRRTRRGRGMGKKQHTTSTAQNTASSHQHTTSTTLNTTSTTQSTPTTTSPGCVDKRRSMNVTAHDL